MITIEEMQEMLEDIASELPEEFFNGLNGGIILLPESKLHAGSINNDLFTLGEYYREGVMGKYIAIYYGSFMRIYGDLSKDELKEQLKATLKHEFRHHLEFQGGERDLEIEDEMQIAKYKNKMNKDS